MMRKLRNHAGRFGPGAFGLVTANGNYVTKHSFGLYSTEPTRGSWQREDPARLQGELDALPKAPFTQTPDGAARIETYTVMHGKHGPEFGLVIGRLDATGERFIANPDADPAVLMDLQDRDSLGRPGTVESRDGQNRFVAAG
jgi:acetyl-CoA C-acetyltransferase